MGIKGFFDKNESAALVRVAALSNGGNKKAKKVARTYTCEDCGLSSAKIISPKIGVFGEGRRRILLWGEGPGEEEDKAGRPFRGPSGELLKGALAKCGVDMDRDCWIVNSVDCHIPGNKKPTQAQLRCCWERKRAILADKKPLAVLLLGDYAVDSFYRCNPDRAWMDLGVASLRGKAVPDYGLGLWVCHSYHPAYILRGNDDKRHVFERDVAAVSRFKKPPKPNGKAARREVITDIGTALEVLANITNRALHDSIPVDHDYETSSYRYYEKIHKVYTVGFQLLDEDMVYVIPLEKTNVETGAPYWDGDQLQRIKVTLREMMENPRVLKVAQHLTHEHLCTKHFLGVDTEGWHWDTKMGNRVQDEAHGVNDLKTMGYLHLGEPHYGMPDSVIGAEPKQLNRMDAEPLERLAEYNAKDVEVTTRLCRRQRREVEAKGLGRAYELLHRGAESFAHMQQEGVRLDMPLLYKFKAEWEAEFARLRESVLGSEEGRRFEKLKGRPLKYDKQISRDDLSTVLVELVGMPRSSVLDEAYLGGLVGKCEFLADELKARKVLKRLGVLNNWLELQVDGYLYPSFNLDIARSYRSCLAKGTRVYVLRDFLRSPKGVKIENVRAGDLVYSVGADGGLRVQRVKWAGKTGTKEVIRLHWKGARNRYGHVDLTPEHLVMLADGHYVEAQNLVGDLRGVGDSKKSPRIRVKSLNRNGDRLSFTGQDDLLEHRFIYEALICSLSGREVVHHRNGNHLDHRLGNLEKLSGLSDHSLIHVKDTLNTPKARARNIEVVKEGWRTGRYKKALEMLRKWNKEVHSLNLSRFTCLRLLASVAGRITSVRDDYDFGTFKKYLFQHGIDWRVVKLRYDVNGCYISKKRLLALEPLGIDRVRKALGMNYYKLKSLYEFYGVPFISRKGHVINNHQIVRVERLGRAVDVYDLEIEGEPNFFANEICVHNSSTEPNFQNVPKRDEEGALIRRLIIPRDGHVILEVDYGGMEVRILACWSRDPVLVDFVQNGYDMHGHWAREIYGVVEKDVKKAVWKRLRYGGKNGFVFPNFYGSWWKNTAKNLWEFMPEDMRREWPQWDRWERHVRECDAAFWRMFKGVRKRQEEAVEQYRRLGYIEMIGWGFRRHGYLNRNTIFNSHIQGPAYHCLMDAINHIVPRKRAEGWATRMPGQIHDAIFLDAKKEEQARVMEAVTEEMTVGVRRRNKWIIVPLDVEWERGEKNWLEMEKVK